jgi:hypothetical protein
MTIVNYTVGGQSMEEFYMSEVEIWRIDYTLNYIETLKRSFVAETQNQLQSQRTRKTDTIPNSSDIDTIRALGAASASSPCFAGEAGNRNRQFGEHSK